MKANCPKCGAEIEIQGEGTLSCPSCGFTMGPYENTGEKEIEQTAIFPNKTASEPAPGEAGPNGTETDGSAGEEHKIPADTEEPEDIADEVTSESTESSAKIADAKSPIQAVSLKLGVINGWLAKYRYALLTTVFLCAAVAYPLYIFMRGENGGQDGESTLKIIEQSSELLDYGTKDSLLAAKKLLSDAIVESPKSESLPARLALIESDLTLKTGDAGKASESFKTAAYRLVSGKALPDHLRVLALQSLGDSQRLEHYLTLLEKSLKERGEKHSSFDYWLMGILKISRNEYDVAVEQLLYSLKEDPSSLRSLIALENLYIMKGDEPKARETASLIDSLKSSFAVKYPELAPTPVKTAVDSSSDSAYERVVPIAPKTMEPEKKSGEPLGVSEKSLARAQELNSEGSFRGAEAELKKAIRTYKKLNPKKTKSKVLSELYAELGRTYRNLFKTDSALEYFKSAVKAGPSNAGAYRGLANIYEELGENRLAASAYSKYLKYEPKAEDASEIKAKIKKLSRR